MARSKRESSWHTSDTVMAALLAALIAVVGYVGSNLSGDVKSVKTEIPKIHSNMEKQKAAIELLATLSGKMKGDVLEKMIKTILAQAGLQLNEEQLKSILANVESIELDPQHWTQMSTAKIQDVDPSQRTITLEVPERMLQDLQAGDSTQVTIRRQAGERGG